MMTSNNPSRAPQSNGDAELTRLREQVTHATLDGHYRVPARDLAHVVAKTDRLAKGHGLIADALRAYVTKHPAAKQALAEALERHDVAVEGVTYCACCNGDPDLVCDACGQHSCWAGEFMCDRAVTAGVVNRADYVEETR